MTTPNRPQRAPRWLAGAGVAVLACVLAGVAIWWWWPALGIGAWPALLLWVLVASKVVAVALALRAVK